MQKLNSMQFWNLPSYKDLLKQISHNNVHIDVQLYNLANFQLISDRWVICAWMGRLCWRTIRKCSGHTTSGKFAFENCRPATQHLYKEYAKRVRSSGVVRAFSNRLFGHARKCWQNVLHQLKENRNVRSVIRNIYLRLTHPSDYTYLFISRLPF